MVMHYCIINVRFGFMTMRSCGLTNKGEERIMQLSNVLLLVVGVAAVLMNPLTDRIGAVIAGLFARLDRSRHPRALPPPSGTCDDGCG
jgi:hypothetical protein